MAISSKYILIGVVLIVLFSSHAHAFGAGNIASLSKIEGKNWRHGDIEDMLKTVACLKHHKWNSMMIKRVYFGNWLRDYSQAMDVATLKGVPKDTIRILVWVLSFMSFGYATAEFEVTEERLGVYRPEEHIDNPRDYADNVDARQYDSRLRPPVSPEELAIDPQTGMKNYISNEKGNWATSLGYVKHSLTRSIHFGRQYASASGMFSRGNDSDLCEALRCLGQALHCLEDFGAHSNYVELSLRELGFHNVFPHTGTNTQINLHGKHVYPLVTGTFGGVDFLHSVLGEATDHVTQTEVDQLNKALQDAAATNTRGIGGPEEETAGLTSLLSQIPGTGDLCREAVDLQRAADAQTTENFNASRAGPTGPGGFKMPTNLDAKATMAKIYPILEFRDKVVRAISTVVSHIPGLEALIETIQEKITLFIMGLLAPYITPLIAAATQGLKTGSTTVVDASGRHQFEPWTDPNCTDPTHSLLSKDHFSNILNQPAGTVAAAILQYCAPRVIYAWEHPDVPVDQVLADVSQVFHHPALRQSHIEVHGQMFAAVEKWAHSLPQRGAELNRTLSSESVKAGNNHTGPGGNPHMHGGAHGAAQLNSKIIGLGSHSKVSGSPFEKYGLKRDGPMDDAPLGEPSPVYGGGNAPPGAYGDNPPYPAQTLDQNQPASNFPTDFTPHDPTTFSTAYNQGMNQPYPQQGSGGYGSPPPPQQQQPPYGGSPYPPQQDFYGGNQYPPQQPYDNNNPYPPQGAPYQGGQPLYPPHQQPPYDPNNPYPQQQQGYGGAGGQQWGGGGY